MEQFEATREDQLSERNLKLGYWWVTNKKKLERILIAVLMVLDIGLVGYAGFGYYDWYFGSGVGERALMATLTQPWISPELIRSTAPRELTIEPAVVMDAGNSRYDLLARANSYNDRFWVEFDYQFLAAGTPVGEMRRGFLLPTSSSYLHALGLKSDAYPANITVRLDNLRWHRLNRHVVGPDYPAWLRERLNLRISEVDFAAPQPTDSLPVSRASFDVRNDSAFGFRQAGFLLILNGYAGFAGVNYVTVSNLRAGESRRVEASWFDDVPHVTGVTVEPQINVFDPEVFLPPSGN